MRIEKWSKNILLGVSVLAISACSQGNEKAPDGVTATGEEKIAGYNADRNAYFGETHVHTKNSFDAYIFNVRTTPDDVYRFAKGETLKHPLGYDMSLSGPPLDFTAVTDHAVYMGMLPAMADPEHPLSKLPISKQLIDSDLTKVLAAFSTVAATVAAGVPNDDINSEEPRTSAWKETIEAAEKHNEPGRLTTFIGYEFTSAPNSANLHRNVFFAGSKVPRLPFSSFDNQDPAKLWKWMDSQRSKGIDSISIPHNSNVSNGMMFGKTTFEGKDIDSEFSALRMRNEPIVEITQVKGTSETHPMLSPNDEWANFEIYETLLATTIKSRTKNGYVREAYRHGLELEKEGKGNPYKFGLIGASDSHVAAGAFDESNYWSKIGIVDGTAERRGSVPPGGAKTWTKSSILAAGTSGIAGYSKWGASGLAGVWAEQNTRASIFSAMQRKETFATSGTRIKVRFFAGFGYDEGLTGDANLLKKAYSGGVPMGGDLTANSGKAPSFLVWAQRDPKAAPLQRLQIIKGWLENGKSVEKIYDIACSDGAQPDATFRCADNGAKVNLSDCTISEDKGAAELKTMWKDPEFKPEQSAFYYVRVLENPTCRWSTWDAIKAGVEPNPDLQKTIQERAWSSPIWYSAKKS